MKKVRILLIVIVVLIAAWLGGAWYTGTRIEAKVSNFVERFNMAVARNPQAMDTQVRQISYERGLLSSHARFAITSSQLGNDPLEADVTLSHGPFPLAALQRGNVLPRMYQAHTEVLATAGPLKMMAGALMNGKPLVVVDQSCNYSDYCAGTGSVPPIEADLDAISKNARLTFGGIQMQFDANFPSDTGYKVNVDARLLPLSIGGEDFGSGQITTTGDAQSGSEVISWKTDQGTSKVTLALAATRPMFMWNPPVTPGNLSGLVKTASARLELSRPMVIDLTARVLHLTKGIDLDAARQQVSAQFETVLAGMPEAARFVQTQGDLLISDWRYADGKLTINGQDNPELLEQIKQGYQAQLQAQEQMLHPEAEDNAASAAAPASAPEQAASGQ